MVSFFDVTNRLKAYIGRPYSANTTIVGLLRIARGSKSVLFQIKNCFKTLLYVRTMILNTELAKGQLISKWFFDVINFLKKRTNEFHFTSMVPRVNLFSFIFWRKSTTPKIHFEIN